MAKLNYYEYKKTAKQGYEDAANKFDWFADYNLWKNSHSDWKIANKSNLLGRSYGLGGWI